MDRAAELHALLEQVRARLRDQTPGSDGPPSLLAGAPLRQVPDAVKARIVARAMADQPPLGPGYPRSGAWRRVVVPLAAVAVLDAIGIGVAAAAGSTALMIGAVVVLLLVGGLAVAGARFALSDPLRFTRDERNELTSSQRWTSSRDWTGSTGVRQRALVVGATRAADRIVRSPTLASPSLDGHRAQLDLVAELDAIDAQAHAAVRNGDDDGVLTRVAALTCYADRLDAIAAGGASSVSLDDVALLTGFLDAALTPGPRAQRGPDQ